MLVDHEAAWHLLTQFVASKSHHGSTQLLAEMQRIMALPHVRVHESTPGQMLRLYGVQLAELDRNQDAAPDAAGGSSPGGMVAAADHAMTGGHDGRSPDEGKSASAGARCAADAGPARPGARLAA